MFRLKQIIFSIPFVLFITSFLYLLAIGLLKWGMAPTANALWLITGGIIGIYFLDIAEAVFAVKPSPFRSIIFLVLFVLVSFFIITSSGSTLAVGLVLTLFLHFLWLLLAEWKKIGNITSWFQMTAVNPSPSVQRWVVVGAFIVFIVETMLFIRS